MNESYYKLISFFLSFYYLKRVSPIKREKDSDVIKKLHPSKWVKASFKNLKKTLCSYDVIYTRNEIIDLLLLKLIGYHNLPPIIVGVHTPIRYQIADSIHSRLHNFLYSKPYKFLLKGVKLIHVVNKFTEELVNKEFKLITKKVPYAFSVSDFHKQAINNKIKIKFDKSKFNIAFIARLTEQKGVSSLINIIDKLSKDVSVTKRINLNIFGSGDKEQKIKNAAKKYGFVKYFGHVNNKYIPNILSKQDLFISTAKWESLPFNVLEAQAMGLPVIAFDIYGVNDIVINKKTGLLVNNEEEFIECIKKFLSNKIKFSKALIINHIRKTFDPEIIDKSMLKLFESVLK